MLNLIDSWTILYPLLEGFSLGASTTLKTLFTMPVLPITIFIIAGSILTKIFWLIHSGVV